MSEIKEFIIDDGMETYQFKNKREEVFAELVFNPTDTGMIERYEKVAKYMQNYNFDGGGDVFAQIRKANEDIKAQFAQMLGDASEKLFARYEPTAVFAAGDMWVNILFEKIGEIFESSMNIRLDSKVAKMKKLAQEKK